MDPTRIGLVLSAGGLRGAAHLGVLRQLRRHRIPIDVIVGASAGAIIAAYYAGVGLNVDDMIADAPAFRGRHLVMHGVTLRLPRWMRPAMRRFCGVIPRRLAELEAARFEVLYHGVDRLGIVCHDVTTGEPCYFSTTHTCGARLADVAKASAAIPGVMPVRTLAFAGRTYRLVDGGLSDSLPIDFARSAELGATHVIVSDCRQVADPRQFDGARSDTLAYIRPALETLRPLRGPRLAVMHAVAQGSAAMSREIMATLHDWAGTPSGACCVLDETVCRRGPFQGG